MTNKQDLVCLSHLRWGFVYQRPQHLLSRAAHSYRVFFFEEPFFEDCEPHYQSHVDAESGVNVIAPYLPPGTPPETAEELQRQLLDQAVAEYGIEPSVIWYYTPMALGFSRHLTAPVTIYDCMDELSAFKGASPILREREQDLFHTADLVFTGGHSLYEVKRNMHPDVHPFPSSIDFEHFAQARNGIPHASDQAAIPHPRVGYCGVIDERMDLELLDGIAELRPDYHFVMIGPVVKIDTAQLPKRPNIHYLGAKGYKELPSYLGGWDVAMLPFARNESTRFISPTKTPEYLAAGRPAVSTSIRDVVRPYGDTGIVLIADEPADFVKAIDEALAINKSEWLPQVDEFLKTNSWDITWNRMSDLIARRRRAKLSQADERTAALSL
jgi:UDP-galactopyranose mutase